jgi:hypothetical protein
MNKTKKNKQTHGALSYYTHTGPIRHRAFYEVFENPTIGHHAFCNVLWNPEDQQTCILLCILRSEDWDLCILQSFWSPDDWRPCNLCALWGQLSVSRTIYNVFEKILKHLFLSRKMEPPKTLYFKIFHVFFQDAHISPAAQQPYSPEVHQPYSPTSLQPYSPAALALQPHNPTARQPYNPSGQQPPYNPSAPHSTTALQPYNPPALPRIWIQIEPSSDSYMVPPASARSAYNIMKALNKYC